MAMNPDPKAARQAYGGSLFSSLRSKGDAVFLSLPPPRAAPTTNNCRRSSANSAASTRCVHLCACKRERARE